MTAKNCTPKVKICGLRDAENALAAATAGADFLGFNFVEGVRRQLAPDRGVMIIRDLRTRGYPQGSRKGPRIVGLFRNQRAEFVNDVARAATLDYVQLCGDEDETYIRSMWKPVFRQVRIKPGTLPNSLAAAVQPHLDAKRIVLLDRYDETTPGGTGITFDWAAAEGVASRDGVLLAGGLTPENLQSAIERLRPWGVDVASGVETDGVVDAVKIRAFIAVAKGAAAPRG
jgi:phosphoribosylanthranilate isomerase